MVFCGHGMNLNITVFDFHLGAQSIHHHQFGEIEIEIEITVHSFS